jgi:quercetin dioxygenase-like cupin family protein
MDFKNHATKHPEAYYVLDGQYSIRCTNETYQARPGDFVFIPKGLPNNYQSGPQGGKVRVISPSA